MSSRAPNPPPDSIFSINLAPIKPALVDLPPRATLGMRREQEGLDAVITEIVNNQPTYGDRAGITATDFTRFTTLNHQFDQIEAQLPLVSKAVEVLTESLGVCRQPAAPARDPVREQRRVPRLGGGHTHARHSLREDHQVPRHQRGQGGEDAQGERGEEGHRGAGARRRHHAPAAHGGRERQSGEGP
ncbi:MAG TPA: hypothetical protein VL242_30855 [Sorangium sp.]|nr:hypothetical protein [Sorangium sp.]